MQILCGNGSNMQLHGRQSTSVGTDKIHAKTDCDCRHGQEQMEKVTVRRNTAVKTGVCGNGCRLLLKRSVSYSAAARFGWTSAI